jgi:hypothetical protein
VARAEGMLIVESLATELVLDDVQLTVTKISRAEFGDVSAGQPLTWTMLEFSVPVDDAAALASRLCAALDPTLGWYCDFRSPDETFVVFGGRSFRYPRGDRERRAEAEAHARSVGVPESQIDWPE